MGCAVPASSLQKKRNGTFHDRPRELAGEEDIFSPDQKADCCMGGGWVPAR